MEPSTATAIPPPSVPATAIAEEGPTLSEASIPAEALEAAPASSAEEPVRPAPVPVHAEPPVVEQPVAGQAPGEQPAAEPGPPAYAIDPDKFIIMSDPSAALPTRRPIWQFALAGAVVLIIALTIFAASATRRPDTGAGKRTTSASPRPTNQGPPAGASSQPAASASEAPKPPTPSVGILKIATSPPGAQVELDGTTVGVSEVTLIDVKPGTHTLKVSKAGFKPVSRDLEVTAGDTIVLDLALSAEPTPVPRRRGPAAPPLPPPPPPPPPP